MHINTSATSYQIGVFDFNGLLRGKRIMKGDLEKAYSEGVRMPGSILACDIWGQDLVLNEFVRKGGDSDVVCRPTGRKAVPLIWAETPTTLIHGWMHNEDGSPFAGDPRCQLNAMLERFSDHGYYPVVAFELEFYLFVKHGNAPKPITLEQSGRTLSTDSILSLEEMTELSGFFNDIETAAKESGIDIGSMTSENGPSQFEINLQHSKDALKAADDALLFKRLVKGVARQHGHEATFMAKPYGGRSGNSMHVHISLANERDDNLYDNGTQLGAPLLRHSIGGLLETIEEHLLIFAPHGNSYRRFSPSTLAPACPSWGYENRTSAIRIPGGPNTAKRLECRVAGADANPYLLLTSILGGIWHGIINQSNPDSPMEGYESGVKENRFTTDWASAINTFRNSSRVKETFSESFIDMFVSKKWYEYEEFLRHIPPFEYETYLDTC